MFATADQADLWTIFVGIGFSGAEVQVSVRSDASIKELKCMIEAASGKKGKLFCTNAGEELLGHWVISACVSDRCAVLLEIEDSFTSEKEALLAVRDATHFTGWKKHAKAGWGCLERYTEVQQLGLCYGVTIGGGRVTALKLDDCDLSGT
jgi:hypothetical protein